jgi:CBS domain-containing protein
MTTIRDVMTTYVVAVRETAGYKDIVTVMGRSRVSAVPVLDTCQVAGVVSEADLLRKLTDPVLRRGRSGWHGVFGNGPKPSG